MTNEEIEAYLRKHTFNGAVREFYDACAVLWKVLKRDLARAGLKLLDMLGM